MNILNNKKLILIFLLALVLRLWQLNLIPPGITNDEANVAYDAWLISKTAKDQWGEFLPLQFRGFGDYRLPVYQYLLVPLAAIFGLKAWVIRLPTVLSGSATVLILYFLVEEVFKEDKKASFLGLISAVLLIFNPWHFGLSRVIMESNVGLFFVLLAVYFYRKSQKSIKNFVLAVLFSLLSFYTYYGYRVFLPLFLLFLTVQNPQLIKNNFIKKMKIVLIGLFLSAPILLSLIQGGGGARLQQVNFLRNQSIIGELNQQLSICKTDLPGFFCKIFFNRYSFFTAEFFKNYFNHFSIQFLFFKEFEKAWGFLPPSPYFYLINLSFFFYGFFKLCAKKEGRFWLVFFLLAPLADSLTGRGHFARSFALIIPIMVFIAYGWLAIFNNLKLLVKRENILYLAGRGLSLIFVAIYCYSLVVFLINYFYYFPVKHSRYSYYEYQPLFDYLAENEDNYQHIYLSKMNHDTKQYIFYLYYLKISPQEYFSLDKEIEVGEDGWVWVKKLGKFEFIDNPDKIENYPQDSLLIVDPSWKQPKMPKPLKQIKYLDESVAFNIYEIED